MAVVEVDVADEDDVPLMSVGSVWLINGRILVLLFAFVTLLWKLVYWFSQFLIKKKLKLQVTYIKVLKSCSF